MNRILLWLGDAARWLGAVIADFFLVVFDWIHWRLNPILSPLLAVVNPICTKLGDVVFAAFSYFAPWFGISVLSVVLGVLMLIAFRHLSNQAAISRAKDDIKANLLAMKLFKDELYVMFQAQWRILAALFRLQGRLLVPVMILALPMMLCLAQMAVRYQWRPIGVGETVLLKMHVSPQQVRTIAASLAPARIVQSEIGPIAGKSDLVWRLRGVAPGRELLHLKVGTESLTKEIVVGDPLSRVSALRPGRDWALQLLHPVEPRLNSPVVRKIEVLYPPGLSSWIYGADYWVIYFFVVSMLTALVLAPVFKVRF